MHGEMTKGNGDTLQKGENHWGKKMLPASHQTLEWGCREAAGSSDLAGIQNWDLELGCGLVFG